jgi:phage shock protein PspC (stress-responsive transcriptional regulator)
MITSRRRPALLTSSSPMGTPAHTPRQTSPVRRRTRASGGVVVGVCAGLASIRDWRVGAVRAAFVLCTLLAGIGLAVYLACWLIIPDETDPEGTGTSHRVVGLAQTFGAAAGLGLLALSGATATVFGFGWAVFALAALVLVAVIAAWRRTGPAWALLPVAALTLPAVAVATAGLRLAPQIGPAVHAPATATALSSTVYRSGLGTMLIDLRRTVLPASGTIPLRIEAGVRRTIVALPSTRCVHVRVHYAVHAFAVHLAGLLTGHTTPAFSDLVLFGRLFGPSARHAPSPAGTPDAPTLQIDFSSQGGSLYVRDYPDAIDPNASPDWPGYPVRLERRPSLTGIRKPAAARMIRAWHRRLAVERASQRGIDALMPGPCR